jgi:sugar lactone lactonase YvrE
MKRIVLLVVLLAAPAAFCEGTQVWKQSSYDEFAKGTAKGVAMRSDGVIELAPSFRQLYVTPSTYIWAIATDHEGNVFAAAGSPSRVYRVSLSGQATVVFQPQELQVQALIAAPDGTLFAATSPDGKVYRIQRRTPEPPAKGQKGEAKAEPKNQLKPETKPAAEKPAPADNQENARVPVDPDYTSSLFFDPKTKYIWALALDKEGRLYVATGDHGEIFRVEKTGNGSVFFKSDEAHIRAMQFDPRGNLIAGTDGSGLVYRISPAGEAFVLYSAPKKEITALAVDPEGNIYAAGVGEKRAQSSAQPIIPIGAQPPPNAPAGPGISITSVAPQTPAGAPPQISMGASGANSSEVYSIAPDGAPRRIWSPQDVVYALAFDARGRLIAGTGNRGHIYALTPAGDYTDLAKATASQVTAFAVGAGGNLFAATSNLGKVFVIGSAPEAEGTYESDVFDARIFSKWGRAEVRGSGSFELYAHSGNVDNPDRNWSPWRKVDLQHDAAIDVPPARFVQWRVVLHPGTQPTSIDSVALNYRAKNVAPVVEEVYVQVGARYNAMPKATTDNSPVTVGPQVPQQRFDAPTPAAVRDRDSIAVRWNARDENDDQLLYNVYFRGDNEAEWKLLKDKLSDRFYSWEAGLLPDGGYTLRVVASDAPSHSPDEALTASKESARFEVDHTPPTVQALNARMENGIVHVTFRAEDGFSPIKRAEYSVDAGEWQFVEPVGQISDAKLENYDFNTSLSANPTVQPAPPSRGGDHGAAEKTTSEHVVMVRVWDRYDNVGTAKLLVK